MKHKQIILSGICIVILAMRALAQDVTVNFDATIDFSKYRSYSFLESKNSSSSKLCHQAILDNIQLQLAFRGLLPVDRGETPNLFIVYNAGIQELISIQGYTYQYEAGWRWNMGGTNVPKFAVGQARTLVIDLVDAEQNRLVWRGVAPETLVQNPETAVRRIGSATKKMFAKYPPKHAEDDKNLARSRTNRISQEVPK